MDPKPPVARRTFLGHPLGLYVLFFAEMWERFSYYGMRAILILYMVKYYKWSQEDASSVYKWYTSLVYLTPILGGFLADRYLGNKNAVLIGAALMAIGHFLMAFDPYTAFYAALVFLIVGNGMFKPNMSTQVGRLYPPGDPRRDGAYTIFYMGINLGAFLSPLLCGWLAENTRWGYHAGFTAAGVGMLLGLLVYLFGMPLIQEVPQEGVAVAEKAEPPDGIAGPTVREGVRPAPSLTVGPAKAPSLTVGPATSKSQAGKPDLPISEEQAERTPSAMPWLNAAAPLLLILLAVALIVAGPVLAYLEILARDSAIGLWIAAGCALLTAWICTRVHNAVRDRVLAILLMVFFVVVFWAAAEQAGNALNLWADQTTDRYLTHTATDVPHPPALQPKAGSGLLTVLNPVPTAWFQSINALGIFVLAPLFAWWWTWNARQGRGTSIAFKIVFGVLLMALSLLFMFAGAWYENRPTTVNVSFAELPPGIEKDASGKCRPKSIDGKPGTPYHTGRLTFDPKAKTVSMRGVLADTERDRLVRDSAPASFAEVAAVLGALTPGLEKGVPRTIEVTVPESLDLTRWLVNATEAVPVAQPKKQPPPGQVVYSVTSSLPLEMRLPETPPGFDLSLAEFQKDEATFDFDSRTLTVNAPLADRDVKSLLVAAGQPDFRQAIYELYSASAKHRVSASWLFWFYILATVGELYLSPVGLSMVSKLAPVKYATMLMGMWFLTSFFGNFLAGMAGENYDKFTPLDYFLGLFGIVLAVALAGFVVVKWVTALMHGVK